MLVFFEDELPSSLGEVALRFNPKFISRSFTDIFLPKTVSIQQTAKNIVNFPEKENNRTHKKSIIKTKAKSFAGFFSGSKVNLRNAP